MRILVTGATGFIGYELACQLAAEGARPRLLVRRPQRGALLARLDAEMVQADLSAPASLERAVKGMDAVIHLGARATFESYHLVRPSIVDGSLALMRAAAAAGVRYFLYGSSLLVYPSQKERIDADTPARPPVDYGRAKLEAEEGLAGLAREHGLGFGAIRLPHVYGARDLMFSRIARGRLVAPGRGSNLFSHLHVRDAARLLVLATQKQLEGVWPAADDRATCWNEFLATIRKFYPGLRCLHLPQWLARAGVALVRPWNALSRRPSLATRDTIIGWNLHLDVEPGLPWNELGAKPEFPTIHEGIPAVLDDCVAYRWRHPVEDRLGW